MDWWLLLERLEDPVHRHVLLNHLPIVGLGVAWVVLGWTLVEGRWRGIAFALGLVALLSASTFFVATSGDAAYPAVFDELDGPGRDWLDHHAHLGDRWAWLIEANAGLALLALGLGLVRERLRRVSALLVFATTAAALVTAAIIADAGGQIRHPELRLSDPPIHDRPGRIR